eukprot:15327035-Ditylum_brightwellii.AAC.1
MLHGSCGTEVAELGCKGDRCVAAGQHDGCCIQPFIFAQVCCKQGADGTTGGAELWLNYG